jgi:putative DNA primase/helicase
VAKRLVKVAASVRIVQLPGDGKDVSDWFAAGGTADRLRRIIEQADAPTEPASPVVSAAPSSSSSSSSTSVPTLGDTDPATGRLILSTERTLPTAEAFVGHFHQHADGRTLWHYAGMQLAWEQGRYIEVDDQTMRHRLLPWLHGALRRRQDPQTRHWLVEDFPANPNTVNAALESIRALTHLPADILPPCWLGDDPSHVHHQPPADEVLPCRSSLLHLPTMTHLPQTPAFFSTCALDYDPDPHAKSPHAWLTFLGQVLGEDYQAWDLLQDWFGYCLTGDTRQQKILLLVGPRRSGKGTIARVLRRLVGAQNVAGPTTSSLAGPFGLQPLIGRSLAIVSDARFGGPNIQTVIERLLCISGEDALTVDRKHTTSFTLKLPTRFVFLTNELPRLADASGALAGRFMMLRFSESFYGREDTELTGKLIVELPGILNWAIEGWKRLRQRGRFVQPASVDDALREMEDLASPVGAFVRDRCVIEPDRRAWVDDLYKAWKAWCEADGRATATTKQTFGRDLMAAVPGILCRRNQGYGRFYEGLGLIEPEPP